MACAGASWPRLHVALKLAAGKLREAASRATSQANSAKRAAFKGRLEAKGTGLPDAFQALRQAMTPPLAFVATREGHPVSGPAAIDDAMGQCCDPIYAGNGDPAE
eukprot:184553-Alexandrium_andersonii.AAC.1